MKKTGIYIALSFLCILLFSVLFALLQNEKIYMHSLGRISHNYERSGDWNAYNIHAVKKPFLEVKNENLLHWDADIYNCIRQHGYKIEDACYGHIRAAFFPLFPLVWKISSASPLAISLLNFIFFSIALGLLFLHLLPPETAKNKALFFLLLCFPGAIIFAIPYSESLFMLSMSIAVVGILKKRYSLYFVGIILLAMVRPATIFVALAFIASDLFFAFKNKEYQGLARRIAGKIIPFILGYALVFLIQSLSSHNPFVFFEAQTHWNAGIKPFDKISDWSTESFAMSSFALFFVAIPSLLYLLYTFFFQSNKSRFFESGHRQHHSHYLLVLSAFYMAGIFLFSAISSGGNMHSFYRFIICSPFFFISLLILLGKKYVSLPINIWLLGGVAACIFFLYHVEFGGDKISFPYLGTALSILSLVSILRFSTQPKFYVLAIVLSLGQLIWNAYLFNAFMSNGWIFT